MINAIQKILDRIATADKETDREENPVRRAVLLRQAINDINLTCLREKHEPVRLTHNAWRVFTLLEETNDALVGRSDTFILGNCWKINPTLTTQELDTALRELLQAGLIEQVNEMERYRLSPRVISDGKEVM